MIRQKEADFEFVCIGRTQHSQIDHHCISPDLSSYFAAVQCCRYYLRSMSVSLILDYRLLRYAGHIAGSRIFEVGVQPFKAPLTVLDFVIIEGEIYDILLPCASEEYIQAVITALLALLAAMEVAGDILLQYAFSVAPCVVYRYDDYVCLFALRVLQRAHPDIFVAINITVKVSVRHEVFQLIYYHVLEYVVQGYHTYALLRRIVFDLSYAFGDALCHLALDALHI